MKHLLVRIPAKSCARTARRVPGACLRAVFGVSCTSSGYIGLLSVLFVGAIGTVIATTIMLLGIASSRTSFALVQSNQAKGLANACVEEALQKVRDFLPFSGSGTLTLGQGSCNYSVTKGSGQNRTVVASGFVGSIVRKISIGVTTINPQIVVSSWQEVP